MRIRVSGFCNKLAFPLEVSYRDPMGKFQKKIVNPGESGMFLTRPRTLRVKKADV